MADREKSGGENIYCAEVENVLAAHPSIVEVAVIGRWHEKRGEMPVAIAAFTTAGLGIEELDEFLDGQLTGYTRPKAQKIVDALPRNPAGKVLKIELRAGYSAACAVETDSNSMDPAQR